MASDNVGELILLGALQGTTLEVRSRVMPPVIIELSSFVDGRPPGPLVQLIQPTVTLRRGPDTLLVSSPAGVAGESDWLVGLAGVSLVVLVVLALVSWKG